MDWPWFQVTDQLPPDIKQWISSWIELGFKVELLDDDECRKDIMALSTLLNRSEYGYSFLLAPLSTPPIIHPRSINPITLLLFRG